MTPEPFRSEGRLTRAGRDHVLEALPRMNAAGVGWLTATLEDMVEGDPWQEGDYALMIVEAWERDGESGDA